MTVQAVIRPLTRCGAIPVVPNAYGTENDRTCIPYSIGKQTVRTEVTTARAHRDAKELEASECLFSLK
jgi:hypothetical protein